jgi:3-oxoacyl-[acyl-carrier protein] reductase
LIEDLRGQVAVVTGGSQGLGEAIARRLLDAGASVTICARRRERVELAAQRLEQGGRPVLGIAADVARPDDVRRVIDATVQRFGALHLLVNNAGSWKVIDSLDLDLASWHQVLDASLTGAFLMSQAAAGSMIAQATGGVIVNIASIFGVVGMVRRAAYVAAKHGLIGLTRALACEWAPHGIKVVAVAPGYLEMERTQPTDYTAADISRRSPLGRFSTLEEVADVVTFLCSKRAPSLLGSVVMVDGGWTAYGGW